MPSVVTLLLFFACLLVVLVGFLWRIGYELAFLKSIVRKARYISIYNCELALESGLWRFSRRGKRTSINITASYPRFRKLLPLHISFDRVDCVVVDDSPPSWSTDYSSVNLSVPPLHPRILSAVRWLRRVLRPKLSLKSIASSYTYCMKSGNTMTLSLSADEVACIVDLQSLVAHTLSVHTKENLTTNTYPVDIISLCVTGPIECTISSLSEISVSLNSVECHSIVSDTLETFLRSLRSSDSTRSDEVVPSQFRLNISVNVRNSIDFTAGLRDKSASLQFSAVASGTSPRATVKGLQMTACIDPVSLQVFSCSLHNTPSRTSLGGAGMKSISTHLMVHNAHLISVLLINTSFLADVTSVASKPIWSVSGRTQLVALSLMDQSNHDRLLQGKNLSLMGSNAKGISVLLAGLDIDASARMMHKLIRTYLKISALFPSSPPTQLAIDTFSDLSTTPALSSPQTLSRQSTSSLMTPVPSVLSFTDLNYAILQNKFARSTPPTPSSSSSSLVPSRRPSSATGAKNWRSSERLIFDTGKAVANFTIDKMTIRNKDDLKATVSRLRVTAKTSPIGSPFTNICFDDFAVNDNVTLSGGVRVWIDGHLSSETAKVFCLIPPVSIRFDPTFAGIVETYLLELVEAVKLLATARVAGSSNGGTGKFIEILQISSLQLELHAKEMLGVLSLDKAMLNLGRSSVYRSNGIGDAVTLLMDQYKDQVVNQWMSLVMSLDVSIGRPMSTARRLISGVTNILTPG